MSSFNSTLEKLVPEKWIREGGLRNICIEHRSFSEEKTAEYKKIVDISTERSQSIKDCYTTIISEIDNEISNSTDDNHKQELQMERDRLYKEALNLINTYDNYMSITTTGFNYEKQMSEYLKSILSSAGRGRYVESLSCYKEYRAVADEIHVAFAIRYFVEKLMIEVKQNRADIANNKSLTTQQKEQLAVNVEKKYIDSMNTIQKTWETMLIGLKHNISEKTPAQISSWGDELLQDCLSDYGIRLSNGAVSRDDLYKNDMNTETILKCNKKLKEIVTQKMIKQENIK